MAETKDKKKAESKVCCVIMPFSDPQGYEEGHFRKIYEQIFKPAIEAAGYEPRRVDEETDSNMIHGKLLTMLVNAPMVLCDLSAKNPNVLYELGIRHAFDRPVVLVQEAGQSPIFDVSGISTVKYRKNRFYDEVIEDQDAIRKAICQTAVAGKEFSIISLAKMQPAEIDRSAPLSKEDEIKILISDLSRKIDRIEEQSSKSNELLNNSVSPLRTVPVFSQAANDEISRKMDELRARVRNLEFVFERNPNDPELQRMADAAFIVYKGLRNYCAHSTNIDPKRMMEIDELRERIFEVRSKMG